MRRPDLKSIKVKVWVYVMLFSMAIILLLWLMQIAFLNVYYESMKKQSITGAAQSIVTLYGKIQGQELRAQLEKIANNNDLFVNITDVDGHSLYAADPVNRDYRTPVEQFGRGQQTGDQRLPRDDPFAMLAQRIRKQPNGLLIEPFGDRQGGGRMLLYGQAIRGPDGGEALLMVSSPLQPMHETVRILSRQLVYLSFAVAALALIVSLLISRWVSRPIVRITEQAHNLAVGRYVVKFEHGRYSEIDRLADTLNRTTVALRQSEKLRNELIANVSHDLRTPLTMIRVYAEMIRDLYGDDRTKREENVAVIIEESDRLASLVQNLLDVSKLQSGVEELHERPFDLAGAIRRILPRYDALRAEGYDIRFSGPETAMALGDEGRIEQVLYNLINNAVNYCDEDRLIRLAVVERQGALRVLVTDNGPGIAPEDVALIWDRYYKVDKEHRRAVTGSGLGLSIVKSIMDLHGMPCGVDSVPGHGSTFWFELKISSESR